MARTFVKGLLAAVLGAAVLAMAQTATEEKEKPSMPSPEEMMAQWAKLNMPGPEHEKLKEAVGTWTTETKMWMGPGEPTVYPGVSKMELIFGGRYLKEHYRCTSEAMPFEGMMLMGYDNIEKKYVTVWLDSMSTGFMLMEGTYDEASKTLTQTGEVTDPVLGLTKMRSVGHEVSMDKHVFEMYRTGPGGHEEKCMEITYVRGG